MNVRMIFKYVFISALLAQVTTSAYGYNFHGGEVLPAGCYLFPEDRQRHQEHIDFEVEKEKALRAGQRPPLKHIGNYKLKPVTIRWTQTQETDTSPITLDASSSSVPSGQIDYTWNNKSKDEVLIDEDRDKGVHWTNKLRITDKVCGVSEETQIRVISK